MQLCKQILDKIYLPIISLPSKYWIPVAPSYILGHISATFAFLIGNNRKSWCRRFHKGLSLHQLSFQKLIFWPFRRLKRVKGFIPCHSLIDFQILVSHLPLTSLECSHPPLYHIFELLYYSIKPVLLKRSANSNSKSAWFIIASLFTHNPPSLFHFKIYFPID